MLRQNQMKSLWCQPVFFLLYNIIKIRSRKHTIAIKIEIFMYVHLQTFKRETKQLSFV